jgi:hypothetical protein
VVDDEDRHGSLLGVEQLLEHSPELMMSLLAESPGDLILEVQRSTGKLGNLCPVRMQARKESLWRQLLGVT